jgi:cell division protein FtsA
MKAPGVAVLDLGSSRVVCAMINATGDGDLHVVARTETSNKGLRRGVPTDLDETAKSIDTAIREVQRTVGSEIESLVVSVSGAHLEGLNGQGYKPIVPRGRHITYQDVMEVVTHSRSLVLPPDREQVQAIPREFRVDGIRDVKRPIGMGGGTLEAITFIVTGSVFAVQNVERAVTITGRKVDQMVVAPLAAGLGVLTQEEIDLGAAVVDIGAGTTDVGIFTHGSLSSAISLPVGAGLVTSDLSKLLKASPEEAERLKIAHALAVSKGLSERETVDVTQIGQSEARPLQRKVLCEIAEARLREIAVMVAQHIEKSGLAAMLPGGIVLTGGGAKMTGMDKLFQEELRNGKVRIAQEVGTGSAVALGLARFVLHCHDDLVPASGPDGWKDRVRTLFSIFQKS